jgi:hypothetical protein
MAAGMDRMERSIPCKLDPAMPGRAPSAGGRSFPQAKPCGVAIKACDDDRFALVVIHPARPPEVVGIYSSEDIIAAWQAHGAKTNLPLLLHNGSGFELLYEKIGAVRLGAITIRRRHALLAGRRPRFLVRRKPSRMPERPVIWRRRD